MKLSFYKDGETKMSMDLPDESIIIVEENDGTKYFEIMVHHAADATWLRNNAVATDIRRSPNSNGEEK